MKKSIKYGIFILAVIFIFSAIYLIYDGLQVPKYKAEVAVVLGNKVNEDGTLSTRLEKRLDTAKELYDKGMTEKIMVSGGLGKEGYYEGDKMKEYLVQKGLLDTIIIVDNQGDNTEMTVRNLRGLNQNGKIDKVIAVSQYFHLTRTKQILHQYGFKEIQGASPRYFEWRDLYSIPREIIAIYVNLL